MPTAHNHATSQLDLFIALLRAELTDLEFAAFAAVAFDGLTETAAALELTQEFGTSISRTQLHRLKRAAAARILQALKNA